MRSGWFEAKCLVLVLIGAPLACGGRSALLASAPPASVEMGETGAAGSTRSPGAGGGGATTVVMAAAGGAGSGMQTDAAASLDAGMTNPDGVQDASLDSNGAAGAGTAGSGAAGATTPEPEDESTSYAVDPAHDNAQPNVSIASPLAKTWTAKFSGAVSFPIVAHERVFVAVAESQANLRALDLETGKLIWGPLVLGGSVMLAYDAGNVYALDENGGLTAFDWSTGRQLWATRLTEQSFYWSPPVAVGGVVYINGLESGGTTIAVDGTTGNTLWTADTFDGSMGAVAVAGNVVYEAEACDQVSTFDAATGHLNWYHHGDCTGGGGAAPAVYQEKVWVRDWAEGNVILDLGGGVLGSFSADVVPAFHDGVAFYTKSNVLTAVSIDTGAIAWSFGSDDQICTSAVVAGAGHQVFVGSGSGSIYELDESSGRPMSMDDLGSPVTCGTEKVSMAVGEGHLLVPAGNSLVVY